jgi:hypothetical protein
MKKGNNALLRSAIIELMETHGLSDQEVVDYVIGPLLRNCRKAVDEKAARREPHSEIELRRIIKTNHPDHNADTALYQRAVEKLQRVK